MLTFSVKKIWRLIKVQDASGSLTAQYEFDKMSGGWNLGTIYFTYFQMWNLNGFMKYEKWNNKTCALFLLLGKELTAVKEIKF